MMIMEGWKTYLAFGEGEPIPLDSILVITGFDIADGKDETVVSVWDRGKCSFSFTSKLSKKDHAKWMWFFGMKTKLPRKLKKQFKNQKLMRL